MRRWLAIPLALLVLQRVDSQNMDVGNALPCEEDNLSCFNPVNPDDPNDCLTTDQLCDGTDDCAGGLAIDEGTLFATLDCNRMLFRCSGGGSVQLEGLCDGFNNCTGGEDESGLICENKCRLPYYGACEFTRECISTELDQTCGLCLPGLTPDLAGNPTFGPCIPAVFLTLDATSYDAAEGVPTVQACVSGSVGTGDLNDIAGESFEVDLSMSDGTAQGGGVDYVWTASPAVLTLTFGSTNLLQLQCVNITIIDDELVEVEEMFTVALSLPNNPRGQVMLQTSAASISIADNDGLVIGFERTAYSVEEGLQVELCVIVINSTLLREVIVTLTSSNVDAEAPGDYTAIAEDLTFSASETRICRNLISEEDGILEEDEVLMLTLATSDDTAILRPSEATVTILNNDTVTIGFELLQYSVTEGSGTSEVCAVVLEGTLEREVIVTFFTTDGTATSVDPVDYSIVSVELRFSAGISRNCQEIPFEDDDILEGTENLFASLTTSDPDVTLAPDVTEVLILEDPNDSVTVGFDPVTYSVEEGFAVEVCARIISGTLEIDAIVTLSSSDGEAEAPDDFFQVSEDLTFTPTEPRQCRNVTTVQDGDSENDEDFPLGLSTIQSGVNLNPDTATVTILDNDGLIIGFERTAYSVEEGLQVEVCVVVFNSTLSREVIVTLSSSDVDAEAPRDYTAISEDLTFSASETRICRDVISADDDILEEDEDLLLTLTTTDDTMTLRPSEATVTILNDDTVIIGFEQPQYSVSEGSDASVEVCALVLDGALEREVIVTFFTTDGTATSVDSVDYSTVTVELTFSAGSPRNCQDIPIQDDDILEGTENLFANLTTSDPDVTLAPDVTEVLIFEDPNDSVTIGFDPVTYSVEEGLAVEVCTRIISGTLEIDATVILSSSNGEAEAPADFLQVSEDLTFTLIEPRQCRNVTTVQDDDSENDEDFPLGLSAVQSGVNLDPDMAIVTILDNDSVIIGFERTAYSVEESLQVEVCVIVINGILSSLREVIVTLSSSNVDAEAPGDYTAIAEDLTFSASETRICRNLISAEDGILEEDEVLMLTLATSDDTAILRPSEATVAILNVDTVTIGFEQPQYSATEGSDASVEVCAVVLDGTLEREVIVTFFTTDSTATSVDPVDYNSTVSVELTFPAGSPRNCQDIPINDDDILEGTENLFANLTTSDPDVILAPDVTEVLILEDPNDSVTIGFDPVTYSVEEGLAVEVCARILSGTLEIDATVTLSSSSGEAEAPADFLQVSEDLTFTPIEPRQCRNVTTVQDDDSENNEDFPLGLSTIQSGVNLDPDTAIITILDNDALCPDPLDIDNGTVTFTGNSVGDTATYTCNSGFGLIGGATTTCTEVGMNSAAFQPAPPSCRRCPFICQNGATCVINEDSFSCNCTAGFEGDLCETDIDECAVSDPCQNGATCVNNDGSFTCNCAAGFEGDLCNTDIDECTVNNPCQNGATCVNNDGSFTCNCSAGFEGNLCETDIDECTMNDPCRNGATCVNNDGSFTCNCSVGYEGDLCNMDIDECATNNTCENGICDNTDGSFQCICDAGFTGELCSENIDDCDPNPCQNGGTCTDGVNTFTCLCAQNWNGMTCEICGIDNCRECEGIPGVCIDCEEGHVLDQDICVEMATSSGAGGDDVGALIGIIIGTMLGALLLIVLIYIVIVAIHFYRKHYASSKNSPESGSGGDVTANQGAQ